MTGKFIAAYTPTTRYRYYPPYINVSSFEDKVVVMLRGNEDNDKCGATTSIAFTKDQFALFLLQCFQRA